MNETQITLEKGSTTTATSPTTATPVDDDKDVNFQLKTAFAIGFRPCGRNLVEFVNESTVLFPVAHHLGILHIESRTMDFFHPIRNVRAVKCFQMSSNRELLAVAELYTSTLTNNPYGGFSSSIPTPTPLSSPIPSSKNTLPGALAISHIPEQYQVALYRVSTRSRIRVIQLTSQSNIVSLCFSYDNKYLVMLEDAPSHNITIWKVSTGKLVTSCKCPSRGSRICINPANPNYISVSGPMILKYWLWNNNEFKIGNFLPQAKEQEHFVDHLWIREYMIALSEHGSLLTFRSSTDYTSVDLIHSYKCHQPSFVRLECMSSNAKGLVVGGSAGFFSIYESTEDAKDPFIFVRSVSIGDVAFECIAMSPSCETVVASTKGQELISFNMSAIDVVQDDKVDYKQVYRCGLPRGGILQIDTCLQRPILVTCGIDKTIRVWNYETRLCEILHQGTDDPSALSIHPSGFQLVVAFKERIRLFNILQESIQLLKEISLKACRVIKFANGGHLFACATGISVVTFSTYTCEPLHTFAGHIGAVKALVWSKDDLCLYSAGHDGAVYCWNLPSRSRCEDFQHIVKQCQYSSLVIDEADPTIAVASGSDGKIREIVGMDETNVLELPAGVCVTSMVLSKDNKRLFAGTNHGSILVLAWPLAPRATLTEYYSHSDPVTGLTVTEDNEWLISCAEDGSLCFFSLGNKDQGILATTTAKALALASSSSSSLALISVSVSGEESEKKKSLIQSDAVLIARDELEERNNAMLEMQQRYDQVKADVEFALHRKENEWIDRLRAIKEESEALVVQERIRYEDLEARYQQCLRQHAEEISQKEASHVKMTQELENQYERKLAQEITRYDALSEELEQTRQRCEALLESQDNQHRSTLHLERKTAQTRAKEQNDVIKRLHDDLKYNNVKFEEVLHQQESEYEQELQKVRLEYEKQLEAERQNTALKQIQLSASNTKLESLKKKMQELKANSHARDVLLSTEKSKTQKLEATLVNYERHFDHCKVSLSDKDKEIVHLKSSNRVLEGFRTVLDHRIESLQGEKVPMQEHMEALESTINNMQEELVDEFKIKNTTMQDVENKDAKIKMLLHETKTLRQNMLKKEYSMSEMTREFTKIAQITNTKELETAIKDAYRVFVIGEKVRRKPPKVLLNPNPSTTTTTAGGGGGASSPSKTQRKPYEESLPTRSGTANTGYVVNSPNKQQAAHNKTERPIATATAITTAPHQYPAATDETLGYDCKEAVNESVKQMEYMSKTITTLRGSLEHTKLKADRIRRDAVSEGSFLIQECNKLRKENKNLHMRVRELDHALHAAGVASPARLSSPKPTTALNPSASTPMLGSLSSFSGDSFEAFALDISSPINKLVPLRATTPGKRQLNLSTSFTPLSSPSPSPSPSPLSKGGGKMLPFVKHEIEKKQRVGAPAMVEELGSVVETQRKEIQRLQAQVHLLMTDTTTVDPASNV